MNKSSKDTILKVQHTISALGHIRSRALFGGYGLSIENAMFGMVARGGFYLRMSELCAEQRWMRNAEQLTFTRRGRAIALNYYLVGDSLWNNPAHLREQAWISLVGAQHERVQRETEKRLKDLPNLTLQMETLLWEAGIKNVEMLRACGAKESWLRLRKINKNLGLKILYALEGALAETHEAALPADIRRELNEWFQHYSKPLHS